MTKTYAIQFRWPLDGDWEFIDEPETFGARNQEEIFYTMKGVAVKVKEMMEKNSTFTQGGKPMLFRVVEVEAIPITG